MAIYNREDPRTALPQLEKQLQSEIDKLTEELKVANQCIKDLSNRNNYSTVEQRIGTWVDGKPLYRKVYVYSGSWSAGATGSFSVADLNIDTCVDLYGYMASDSYKHIGFDFYNSNYDYIYMSSASVIYWKVGWASTKNVIVVEYTKTTD